MGTIRADGMGMTNPDDDESFQMLVGDVIRILIELRKGSRLGAGGAETGGTAADLGALLAANNLSDLTSIILAAFNGQFLSLGNYATSNTYTSGTAQTHTFLTATRLFIAVVIGGGGGGGGPGSPTAGGGGGGGGGGTCILFGRKVADTLTYTVGGGGTAGGGQGGDGTASSIVFNGSTYTASPGTGTNGGAIMGGYGGTATTSFQASHGIVLGLRGQNGSNGGVGTLTHVGGLVTAVSGAPGPGGYPAIRLGSSAGNGGDGGTTGNSGSAGSAGSVFIYEM